MDGDDARGLLRRLLADAADMLSVVRGLECGASISSGSRSTTRISSARSSPAILRARWRRPPTVVDLDKVIASGPPPEVSVAPPAAGAVSPDGLATSRRASRRQGGGTGRVEWRVNGVTTGVTGDSPVASERAKSRDARSWHSMPATTSSRSSPTTRRNLLAVAPARTIRLELHGRTQRSAPARAGDRISPTRSRIEAGQSRPEVPPLSLAVKDAKGVRRRNPGGRARGHYAEVGSPTRSMPTPPPSGSTRCRPDRPKDIHPRDTFILFAAGAWRLRGRPLLPDPAGLPERPRGAGRQAIGQDRMQDWVANRIKARRALILLDTCESGALVAGHTLSRTERPHRRRPSAACTRRPGGRCSRRRPLASAALEGYKGHGVFTWALLDALRNGDRNGNGTIELIELVGHVQATVPRISAEMGGGGRASAVRSPCWIADASSPSSSASSLP